MNSKKRQAAVAGLLDDIKKSGINPASVAATEDKTDQTGTSQPPTLDVKPFYHLAHIDTSKCTPWSFANRLYIDTETCSDLISSIKQNGQQIPAIVRKRENETYELICGARRLFACKQLQIKLLVAIIDVSNQDAALLMDLENREREDISAYERGIDFANWIRHGLYKNATEICNKTGIKKALLSQLLNIANLDKSLIAAFKKPSDIPLRWARELYRLSKSSEENHLAMIAASEAAFNKNLSPQEIYQSITQSVKSTRGKPASSNKKDIKFVQIKQDKNNKIKLNFSKKLTKEGYDELLKLLEKFTAVNKYVE